MQNRKNTDFSPQNAAIMQHNARRLHFQIRVN